MKLSEILTKQAICVPLESRTKHEVLRELVGALPSSANSEIRERIYEAILEREARLSTGIGQGIAIPHGSCALLHSIEMAVGIARTPIEFETIDGEPVVIFFLLASPAGSADAHIQALGQISRLCISDEFRAELAAVSDAEEVLALLRREEVRSDP
jgi:mannitol/fructose-specific phosphotransferase system IIA component (Ntr-type)